jgi:hypothetical protein
MQEALHQSFKGKLPNLEIRQVDETRLMKLLKSMRFAEL